MTAENDERYSRDFCPVIEAVRSAVTKLAEGKLHVSVPDDTPKKHIRYAPSFVAGSERVHWLSADVTKVHLGPAAYDVWHDRAVFHFLTATSDRLAYVRQVVHAVKVFRTRRG